MKYYRYLFLVVVFYHAPVLFADGIDEYTKLMLHMDGADGSTSFPDSSGSSHGVAVYGESVVDAYNYKFSQSGAFHFYSGDYLLIDDSEDFDFNGDFTIDFWLRFSVVNIDYVDIIAKAQSVSNRSFFLQFNNTTDELSFFIIDSGGELVKILSFIWSSLVTDTWYHVAIVRSFEDFYLFVNGSVVDTASSAVSIYDSTADLVVANAEQDFSNSWGLYGNIDELRISNIARWTSSFVPPSEAYSEPSPTPTPSPTPYEVYSATLEGDYKFLMALSGLLCGALFVFGLILAFRK